MYLVLQFHTDEGGRFILRVTEDDLVPIDWSDVESGERVEKLEQEIADSLMINVAETIFRYSAREFGRADLRIIDAFVT